jgi:hypothetical protein
LPSHISIVTLPVSASFTCCLRSESLRFAWPRSQAARKSGNWSRDSIVAGDTPRKCAISCWVAPICASFSICSRSSFISVPLVRAIWETDSVLVIGYLAGEVLPTLYCYVHIPWVQLEAGASPSKLVRSYQRCSRAHEWVEE